MSNRSILGVCEDYESEDNAEITIPLKNKKLYNKRDFKADD